MEKLKMKMDQELSRLTGKPTLRGVKVDEKGDSSLVIGQLSHGKGNVVLEVPIIKSEPEIWDCVM